MAKRILVFSHNPFSNQSNNGKTLESFFKRYPSENLAQIFLEPSTPDFSYCGRYYRITDYEVLSSVFTRGGVGHTLKSTDSNSHFLDGSNSIARHIYHSIRKKSERTGIWGFIHSGFVRRVPAFMALRELLWKYSKWETPELHEWVKEFSPDVLFFQGSSCAFAYKIALRLSEKYKLPLVLQLTDDYTRSIYPLSVVQMHNQRVFNRHLARAIQQASTVIPICEYMEAEYMCRFGGRYVTLMNTTRSIGELPERAAVGGARLLYAGNVLIGRHYVLGAIGRALSKINSRCGTTHTLTIHSPWRIPDAIASYLAEIPSVVIGRTLSAEELSAAIADANVVVHVESFDARMRRVTRLSMSTKIPEYLASRRCMLAVGPADVASIRYLLDNAIAVVARECNETVIESELSKIIDSPALRLNYSNRGFQHYLRKHSPEVALESIAEIIESA
jgi:hypothetical protein